MHKLLRQYLRDLKYHIFPDICVSVYCIREEICSINNPSYSKITPGVFRLDVSALLKVSVDYLVYSNAHGNKWKFQWEGSFSNQFKSKNPPKSVLQNGEKVMLVL